MDPVAKWVADSNKMWHCYAAICAAVLACAANGYSGLKVEAAGIYPSFFQRRFLSTWVKGGREKTENLKFENCLVSALSFRNKLDLSCVAYKINKLT